MNNHRQKCLPSSTHWRGAALLVLATLLWAGNGSTALYCVVDFGGERCRYHNLETCRQAAGEKGSCVLNRSEIIAPTGGAPFCLVENWRTACIYKSRDGCEKQAAPRHATCLENPNLGARHTPDPATGNEQPAPTPSNANPHYLPSPDYQPIPGAR